MSKICDYENCSEEVADWQTHCPKHYAIMMQTKKDSSMAQQPAPAQKPTPVQQPKPMPVQQQAPVEEEMIDLEEPVYEEEQQEPEETNEVFVGADEIEEPEEDFKEELPLPKIPDRERLIVKQTAFKGAIELMSKMEFETKDFDSLIGEIETLTIEFYRLIVKENEDR